jgi:hypothetical protein
MKTRSNAVLVLLLLATACVWDELPIDEPEIDCSAVSISLEVSKITNASICGDSDGALEVKVTGGEAPYSFSIGAARQASHVFDGLKSDVYTIQVVDINGCTAEVDSVLISVDQFSVDFTHTPNNECIEFNGAIDILVNETNGPYEFQLDMQGPFITTPRFENVKDGDHFVKIRDADGCSITRMVQVGREATGVSWQNDILPIMTTSCAVSGCHNGIHLPRDWRVYSQVNQFKSTIRKRTQDKSMPAEGTLTAEQIALIACWIDDGALLN